MDYRLTQVHQQILEAKQEFQKTFQEKDTKIRKLEQKLADFEEKQSKINTNLVRDVTTHSPIRKQLVNQQGRPH